MFKKVFVVIIVFFLVFVIGKNLKHQSTDIKHRSINIRPQDLPPLFNTLPLKLVIKTDKKIYQVGDDIKILFTVENINDQTFNLNYHPLYGFDYEISVSDNRKYERFPDQGSQQSVAVNDKKIEILPHGQWMQEQLIASIRNGKVYEYKDPFSDKGKKLYYDGFYIADDTFRYKGTILIKNGSGEYNISFMVCQRTEWNERRQCVKSEPVEFLIGDK